MNSFSIAQVDLAIILGYLAIVFFIGLIISRQGRFADDFFLAGRSLGWVAIGFSLFASNISGSTLIGLSGQAYSAGISVSNYEWMATIILVILALFFLPFFIQTQITTIPEFLELRYNRFCRKYFSIVTIFLNIVVDTAGSLYGGALVLNVFFPEFDIWQICVALALIAGVYTSIGGLGAVVYTDILQGIVILMGSGILLFAVLGQFDFSWDQAVANTSVDRMSLIRPADDPNLPWTGTLIGLPILGFYYWALNQQIAQRVLAARDLNNARWGALLGGLLKLPVLFIMVIPGAFAFALFPNLENFDMVFPTMVTNLLPPGVIGIVLSGLIAAIMSSVDSALNASSTLIVMDFIKLRKPNLTDKDLSRYGRQTTLLLMVFAALWAPMIGNFEGLFAYLQKVLTYVIPPVVTIFVLGLFYTRGNAKAAVGTLLTVHGFSFILLYLSSWNFFEIHYTVLAGLLTILSSVVYIAISLSTAPPPPEKLRNLTWKYRGEIEVASPVEWYQNFRLLGTVLLILTMILVISFW